MTILTYYLVSLNLLTLIVYGTDKRKAKKNKWRIAEKTLILLAILGGFVGAWAGMRIFHHKTMHKKFKYGIPFIFCLQLAAAFYFLLGK